MFALESLMKTTTLGRICVIVTIPILLSTPVQTAQAKVLTTIVMVLITNDELTTCSADINGDNITGTSDLLHFLSLFNCVGDCADLETGDFSGDGVVGTADLLILLSEFGLYCH